MAYLQILCLQMSEKHNVNGSLLSSFVCASQTLPFVPVYPLTNVVSVFFFKQSIGVYPRSDIRRISRECYEW